MSTAAGPVLTGQAIPPEMLGQKQAFEVSIARASTFLGQGFPYSLAVVMKNGQPFRFTLNNGSEYRFSFADTPVAGDFYYARLIQLPSTFSIRLLSQLLQIGWVKALSSPITTM